MQKLAGGKKGEGLRNALKHVFCGVVRCRIYKMEGMVMEKQFYNFVKDVYDKQLGVEGIAIADV